MSEITKWFKQKPTRTVEEATEQFPGADRWTIQKARRDALRETIPTADVGQMSQLIGADLTPTARAIVRSGALRPIQIQVVAEKRKPKVTIRRGDYQTLILSDLHAGKDSHSPHALDLAIQIGQSAGVDDVIFNGDMFDVHALSRYTPSAERPIRWAEEREYALKPIGELVTAFKDCNLIWHYGNHCVRPNKWISANAPQLQGLFTLESLLGIDAFSFGFPEHNRSVVGGKVLVKHGVYVSGNAAYSVTKEVVEAGMSVVMGHVHRLGMTAVTKTAQVVKDDPYFFGIEQGCMCALDADYLAQEQTANWQHGAVILTQYNNVATPIPELIQIYGRNAFFRGQMFTSRVA